MKRFNNVTLIVAIIICLFNVDKNNQLQPEWFIGLIFNIFALWLNNKKDIYL